MPVTSTKTVPQWRKDIEASIAKRRQYEVWWDANLKAYAPSVNKNPEEYGEEVNTNRDFTVTERKKADLFYQRPDVTLMPSPLLDVPMPGPVDPTTGQPSQIPATVPLSSHQHIVNEKLGEDGIDASDMMDSVIFDIECPQGVGFTIMGYESVTVDVEQVDPKWTPPVDPLTGAPDPTAKPKTITVPVPVHEHCFWEHFSGKQAIIPWNHRSTKWDKASYLGHEFTLPLTPANRKKYKLPDDFEGKRSDGKQYYDHGAAEQEHDSVFTGQEIWYRSVLYREDIMHPEHLTHLVLIDGLDDAPIHEDCPYQTLLPNGQLSPDSLIGFPIHPFSVRKLSDSAYVPSDSTMMRPLVNELNVFREQSVQFRDAATSKFMANGDVLPKEALAKIVRAPIGGIIVVPGEAFHGEGAIKELPQGTMPRENFAGAQAIENDIDRTVGVDGTGAGVQSVNSQTATEAQLQQGNANARLDKERSVLLKRYCKGVTKFSTLIQRYLPVAQAAAIVGPQSASIWDVWRKQVPSALAFTAMPDSALRVDQAVDQKSFRDFYSFVANDPFFAKGRAKLAEKLCLKHHLDPNGVIAPPDPPKPEPPKMSFSFKGEDLVGPQAVIVLGIAEQLGIKIDPSWVTIAQAMAQQDALLAAQADAKDGKAAPNTKHGGLLPPGESLSKHASDQTGGMQNTGAPAAMGAGGGMLQ